MKNTIALLLLLANVGCASIVNGTNQTLSVETKSRGERVVGAVCKLANNKGTWFVTTPGSVSVHRSYDAMHISCEADGYQPADYTSESSTQAMAFGNIIFGGIIGAGIDVASGAAYDYPDSISFEMMRTQVASAPSAVPVAVADAPKSKPNCYHYTIGKDGRLTCSK